MQQRCGNPTTGVVACNLSRIVVKQHQGAGYITSCKTMSDQRVSKQTHLTTLHHILHCDMNVFHTSGVSKQTSPASMCWPLKISSRIYACRASGIMSLSADCTACLAAALTTCWACTPVNTCEHTHAHMKLSADPHSQSQPQDHSLLATNPWHASTNLTSMNPAASSLSFTPFGMLLMPDLDLCVPVYITSRPPSFNTRWICWKKRRP